MSTSMYHRSFAFHPNFRAEESWWLDRDRASFYAYANDPENQRRMSGGRGGNYVCNCDPAFVDRPRTRSDRTWGEMQ